MITRLLRYLFYVGLVRPAVHLLLGLAVRNRERLPAGGPAIVIANHNSHLDAMVLVSLFPSTMIDKIRPVAAADYFLRNKIIAWFSRNIVGIIPLARNARAGGDPLAGCSEGLEKGQVLILFPEGSRGQPERLEKFRSGIAHLAKRHPDVPIFPVFLHGLGKALPKGQFVLVPFTCNVLIGEPIAWNGDKGTFMETIENRMSGLIADGNFPAWE